MSHYITLVSRFTPPKSHLLTHHSTAFTCLQVINSFQGLRDAHKQLLSKLITGAKATEEEFLAHLGRTGAAAVSAAAAAGPSGSVGEAAAGPSGSTAAPGPLTSRGGRSAQKAASALTRGGGGGSGGLSAFDLLNSARGGGGSSFGGGVFDVLMTPSFPPDDLSMMLDVLNGFDNTPRF